MKTTWVLGMWAGIARAALDVDFESPDSIKEAARSVAYDLMTYYKGNQSGQIPGILPGPPPVGDYYWWEGGALWGTLVDYWHYTGDTSYNDVVEESLIFQAGPPQNSYMPPNWTASLGNDDQGFWGMSAMLAAEVNFQNPPQDQPQWLALAQAVFNTQASPERHDDTCGGGLRWQIPLSNTGYDYKNAIANGIFFNLGARLARYTDNQTYADWAVKTWDWVVGVGLIDDAYNVYDGGHVEDNCTDIFKAQFSYNAAVFMQGAAFMYNYTNGSDLWRERVDGLVNRSIEVFFPKGIAVELSCELPTVVQCKTDMLSFKGYLHRWMASTTQLAPFTYEPIMATLKNSTAAAVKSCSGGYNGRICGFQWVNGTFDNITGAGQQMNVLAALSSLLIEQKTVVGPVTNTTGGTSPGDYNAGSDPNPIPPLVPLSKRDQIGAGFATGFLLLSLMSILIWMCSSWTETAPPPVRRKGKKIVKT